MGRQKVDTNLKISDNNQRSITFCKRRKGVIKKLNELSKMCDKDVFLIIRDKQKNRYYFYQSTQDFGMSQISDLQNKVGTMS